MSCRLLNQIFRVTQTNHFHPVLYKIMLNAFPNNNSLLKNTTTSFYTILTSNIYKNHNLAKQKNVLKSSARLESDINCNKQVKKSKASKPKKKTPKLKYTEIRICRSEDKCKEKMICICMPISKFKEIRSKTKLNEEEPQEMTELATKCPSVICTQGSQPFCWVPPQKKPCPVQTWILGGPQKTCGIPCYANKVNKSTSLDCKSSQTACLMKPRSSTNYCAPAKQPSPTNYCAPPKQPRSANMCAPLKQPGSTNVCTPSKQPGSTNSGMPPKQPGLSNICAQPKLPNTKPLKN